MSPEFRDLYRYIELNPAAANMVRHPAEYRWSSYDHHALGKPNRLIRDHVLYEQLGQTPTDRQHAYRELFRYSLDMRDIHAIRTSTRYETPLGNERFKVQIETALGRKFKHTTRGRPRQEKRHRTIAMDQER